METENKQLKNIKIISQIFNKRIFIFKSILNNSLQFYLIEKWNTKTEIDKYNQLEGYNITKYINNLNQFIINSKIEEERIKQVFSLLKIETIFFNHDNWEILMF